MSILAAPPSGFPAARLHRSRRLRLRWVSALAVVAVIGAVAAYVAVRFVQDDSRRKYLAAGGWPSNGQAAYLVGTGVLGTGEVHASPVQRPAPIASVAKVMTAYLVLHAAPLGRRSSGFSMTVSAADVADTSVRRGRDESVVRVAEGEVLTERDALAALLLPSANNVAVMLARRVGGTVRAFVARMNTTAARLGMRQTHYTDPSGFTATTVSTAADQLVLADKAMHNRTFAALVARSSYPLPVVGTVHNTDTLLGTRGFVGIKTGSMDASGGCFMFRTVRVVGGRRVAVTGVVLGQRGHNLIRAGLYAASQLADRISNGQPPG